MPVDAVIESVEKALPKWTRCRDAAAGADAVKAKGAAYLPLLSGHKEAGFLAEWNNGPYEAYKQRAVWYGATGRTVEGLAGAVLRKPLGKEGVPTLIEDHLKDVTLTSISLDGFAVAALTEVINPGRYGILLDMPTATRLDGNGNAIADPTARPFWVGYLAEQIVNWDTTIINGTELLSMLVLKESYTDQDPKGDRFKKRGRTRYRELRLVIEGTVRQCQVVLHENPVKDDSTGELDTSTFVEGPPMTLVRRGVALDFIPFTFINPDGIESGICVPPLDDLVEVNFAHYRNSADYEHGLHHLTPTPYISGFKTTDKVNLGPTRLLQLEDPNAKAGVLEATGTGVGQIKEAMVEKQNLMATLGGRLLEQQKKSAEAAATVAMRQTGEQASLGAIANAVSLALTKVLQWHAWWFGADPATSQKVSVKLNTDFLSLTLGADTLALMFSALQDHAVSFETWYALLERAELARPGITAEVEKKLVEAQLEDKIGQMQDLMGSPEPGGPGGRLQKPPKPPVPPKA